MDENFSDLLKTNRIFSSLDARARQWLLPKLKKMELSRGEILFSQGNPSEAIYLLVSGKLSAELTLATAENKIVGYIDPGETAGELGVLANEPRSTSVRALKDSVLLQISAKNFLDLCYQNPAVMFAAVHGLIDHSNNIQAILENKKHKHIIIIPAHQDVYLEDFAKTLTKIALDFSRTEIATDFILEDSDDNIEFVPSKKNIRTLYILKGAKTALAKIAFKKADTIYIVGHPNAEAKIDPLILDHIKNKKSLAVTLPSLILLHPEHALRPKYTLNWLSLYTFKMYHHVRLNNNKDFQRLARFILGKATGLVLGGGGTRGWAHLGAIKALRESKIPIDMIGGCSVGAIIGASYALNESYNEACDKFYDIVVSSNRAISWRHLTWPAISLFSAKNFTESLMDAFDKKDIEELWIPYFCISSNMAKNVEAVHQTGKIWEKLRASASIPGLVPPMILEEEIHADGGLLNNLPVDIMRQFIGNKGRVIAVELNSFSPDNRKYNFPPVLTFLDALFAKIGIGKHKYKFPHFVDTFLRGLFLGSSLKSKQNSLGANLFIGLNLSSYSILRSNPKQANGLVQIGYETTLKQLRESKK